jgi:hypothetical protein
MEVINALPVGTVAKLKKAEKRVVIIGIYQTTEMGDKREDYDYIGVPYPEGFIDMGSTLLFQESDIESVQSIGFSDIERQGFIALLAEKMKENAAQSLD